MRKNSRQNLYLLKARLDSGSNPRRNSSGSTTKSGITHNFHYTPSGVTSRKLMGTEGLQSKGFGLSNHHPHKSISPGVSPVTPKLTAYHGKDALAMNSVNTSLLSKVPEAPVNKKAGVSKAFRNNSNDNSPSNSLKKQAFKENQSIYSHPDSVNDAGLKNYLKDMRIAYARAQNLVQTSGSSNLNIQKYASSRDSFKAIKKASPHQSSERNKANISGITQPGYSGAQISAGRKTEGASTALYRLNGDANGRSHSGSHKYSKSNSHEHNSQMDSNRKRNDSNEGSLRKYSKQSGAIQLTKQQMMASPILQQKRQSEKNSFVKKSARVNSSNQDTLIQMSEVLKKLNLGEASNHFIKYMGKQFKPASQKNKEDESIKKLRNFLHYLIQKKVIPSSTNPQDLNSLLKTLENQQKRRAKSLQKEQEDNEDNSFGIKGRKGAPFSSSQGPAKKLAQTQLQLESGKMHKKSSSQFNLNVELSGSTRTPRQKIQSNQSSSSSLLQGKFIKSKGTAENSNLGHCRSKSSQLFDPKNETTAQSSKHQFIRGAVGKAGPSRRAEPSLQDTAHIVQRKRASSRSIGNFPKMTQGLPESKIPRIGASYSQSHLAKSGGLRNKQNQEDRSNSQQGKRVVKSGNHSLLFHKHMRSQGSLQPSSGPPDTGGSNAQGFAKFEPALPLSNQPSPTAAQTEKQQKAAFQFQPRTRNLSKKPQNMRESSAPTGSAMGLWSGSPPRKNNQAQPPGDDPVAPTVPNDSNRTQASNEQGQYVNDNIVKQRENLISFSKLYISKHNELPPTTLEFYKMIKLIGKGAFGKVTLAVHKLTGKYVAVKMIEKEAIKDEYSRRKVFQEVYILKKSRHNNVAKLLEIFESPKHLHMVMDYAAGGDLLQFVKKRKRLDEKQAKFFFKQIVYGLGHIHSRSVIHRDVKLDNILIDADFTVKICDFGVSKIIRKDQLVKDQCGTPAYIAPEIVADQGYRGFSVDLWSLGVLLFAMVCGTVPFKAGNMPDLHKLILKAQFSFPSSVKISKGVKDLISKLIVLSPNKRLSVPQILRHPWVRGRVADSKKQRRHTLNSSIPFQRPTPSLTEPRDVDEDMYIEGEDEVEEEEEDFTTREAGLLMPHLIPGKQAKNEKPKDDGTQSLHELIDTINLDNLYRDERLSKEAPLTYNNYCLITQAHLEEVYDEQALNICETFGYPREFVIRCLKHGDLNHATTSYYLLSS